MARKKGCYSTCITKATKLNETKPTEVVHTAINSKLMNIIRVQKAQETETTPTLPRYNIKVTVAVLY